MERREQRPRRSQLLAQQRDARVLVELEIIEARLDGGEQLGDGALMHVRVLPQVERREMEAEHVDRAPHARSRPRSRIAAPPTCSELAMVLRSAANSSGVA